MLWFFYRHILRRIYASLGIKIGPGRLYVTQESGLEDKILSRDEEPEDEESENSSTTSELEAVEEFPLVPKNLNILAIARDMGNRDGDGKEPITKRLKLEDEQRGFLLYSLAVQENVDSHFGGREMAPQDFSWTADDVSNNLTCAGVIRLFHEIRPFLTINPLDELILRLSKDIKKNPIDLIANVSKISYYLLFKNIFKHVF